MGAAAVVALVAVVVIADGWRLRSGITTVDLSLAGAGAGATNYLLVGSDSRAGTDLASDEPGGPGASGSRADLILILHLETGRDPRLVPIPRDLVVDVADRTAHRLAVTLTKGPQTLVDALCDGLGIGVDHVVIVDFAGFERLVDTVGGVDIDFAEAVRDEASGLSIDAPGVHHLGGAEALAFVRSRHPVSWRDGAWVPSGGADARLDSAQKLVRALAPSIDERRHSLWGMHQLLSAVAGTVTVDGASGRPQISELADGLSGLARTTGRAFDTLPAVTTDGEIPTATLAPGATDVLRSIGAGATDRCPNVPAVAGSR